MTDQQATPNAPVVPSFWVDSVETLRSFYLEKLGFGHMMGIVGKDGQLDFCIVFRDDAMVMIGRPGSHRGVGPTIRRGGLSSCMST